MCKNTAIIVELGGPIQGSGKRCVNLKNHDGRSEWCTQYTEV